MSTFLYFIPKQLSTQIQNADEKREAGLHHIEPEQPMRSNWISSGPGGLCGAIGSMCLPDGKDGPAPLYEHEKQTWRKHPSGKYWVGVWRDNMPSPETLERPKKNLIPGKTIKLLDGNDWVIPICVPPLARGMGGSTLPRQYDLDDEGNLIGAVRKDYQSLADRTYDYYRLFVGSVEYPPAGSPEDMELFRKNVDLAAELIGINYRVGRFEAIAMLHLLGSDEFHRVLRAAIEADEIEAALDEDEKKAQESGDSATSSGGTVAVAPDSKTLSSDTPN